MPETTSVGILPALNLLFYPRAIRFQTAHYQVLLQHWTQLGWVKQWRQGIAVVFGVDWGTVVALPRPIYDPRCTSYNSQNPRRTRRTFPPWGPCPGTGSGEHISSPLCYGGSPS